MIEHRPFPFGGIPVYNPQSLSKQEALAQFHVRIALYDSLLTLLRQKRAPHVLVIGARGMGKTTLLQRIRYGVEDDEELNRRYLVLFFPEEQYNVNRLDRFLLNTLDAVADAMERLNDHRLVNHVESYAESLGKLAPAEIEQRVPEFLADFGAQIDRNFLLLMDNADRLFEAIDTQQQWRVRELLATRNDITFFGATTQASEGIYGSDRAFFEFFQIQHLSPLTYLEVRDLLLRLSESVGENESDKGSAKRRVEGWLDANHGRLRTLVQLTGGNPRTTVLLFHLVLDGLQGGAREYLEQLLDQVTPNYKGRVDELSPQAQQVFDAVALKWDPVTAFEVACETGLETGVVSTQLTRLVRQGVLEKVDPGDSKKALYQVSERFFNIWYLMRASRRVRTKLRWFVEFLRVFFDNVELEQLAWDRIAKYRPTWAHDPAEVETAFAYFMASGLQRTKLEDYLTHHCSDTEMYWRPYLDLIGTALHEDVPPQVEHTSAEPEVRSLIEREPENGAHWSRLGNLLRRDPERVAEAEAAFRTAIELDSESATAWSGLGALLAEVPGQRNESEEAFRNAIRLQPHEGRHWANLGKLLAESPDQYLDAEAAYRKAIELNPERYIYWRQLADVLSKLPERVRDAEAAYHKALKLNPKSAWSWHQLALLLRATNERRHELESVYRQAVLSNPDSHSLWHELATCLAKADKLQEAEVAFCKANALNPKCANCWSGLGSVLRMIPGRESEAEFAHRRAVEIAPNKPLSWHGLGRLLSGVPNRADEAEAALRQAIQLDPDSAILWHDLAKLLDKQPIRSRDTEGAYRRAVTLEPQSHHLWHDLAVCLAGMNQTDEAEAAFRRANELDPACAACWLSLGELLIQNSQRATDAESAFQKAISLDPESHVSWFRLATLLAELPDRGMHAEAAYRKAIDLDPKRDAYWLGLAELLARQLSRLSEAEAAYREGINVNPQAARNWRRLGFFLACRAGDAKGAEQAFRSALRLQPEDSETSLNLAVLLYCETGDAAEALRLFEYAQQCQPGDPIAAAVLAAAQRRSANPVQQFHAGAAREVTFWAELTLRCINYPLFGKLMLAICDLIRECDPGNRFVTLYSAVALSQLNDFPRASVVFEDALLGDPIELLKEGQPAIEVILSAGVKSGRAAEFIRLLDKKGWKDAWRPIYEALRAVESGSADYLKRVAVEVRTPALDLLRRIAPETRDMPAKAT